MSGLELVHNADGGYFFLPSVRPFSAGVAADDAHDIVRVPARAPVGELPELLRAVIEGRYARPLAALCSVELRSAHPASWAEFETFNAGYAAWLDELGITVGGINPVARTNVAPAIGAPSEAVVHAIAFTVPRSVERNTFVVAGAAEVVGNVADGTVRPGDKSTDALQEKVEFVLARMTERLAALRMDRDRRTSTHVYTVRTLPTTLSMAIGRATGGEDGSYVLHLAKPPIEGLEFEMDMRSVRHERPA
jgi:hypothetical protein